MRSICAAIGLVVAVTSPAAAQIRCGESARTMSAGAPLNGAPYTSGEYNAGEYTAGQYASPFGIVRDTVRDVGKLPSREALGVIALGGLAAFGAHSIDGNATRELSNDADLRSAFRPGAVLGSTPFALGAAVATYGIGRAFGKPCASQLGADLIQAQLLAEALTIGIKQATRRSRPAGSGFSFPSGHTTVSFASATVLQRHFGWKVGVPSYLAASYVAASRVGMKRHYLSDVAFGAALGIVAGRTVTVGRNHMLMLTPAAPLSGSGAGLGFTLLQKR